MAEVANRFGSLMTELDRLKELDLADIQPVNVFPDEGWTSNPTGRSED